VTVLIADPDPLAASVVLESLQTPGIVVAAVVGTSREAVELSLHYVPDVVILDTSISDTDDLRMIREITAGDSEIAVVVVSANDDEESQLSAIAAGAVGFLPKAVGTERLPDVVRSVAAGQSSISRALTKRLIEQLWDQPDDGIGTRPVWSNLTNREWQVLALISQGSSTRDIAGELHLAEDTIYGHIKGVFRKLGVTSRQEAVEAAEEMRRAATAPVV
jgi:DNA-binding NarL/FixJ family response regulator